MAPQDQTYVKFIGAMFNSIVGGFLGDVQAAAAPYGGDIRGLMRDLSGSPYFTNTLAAGTDRDIAQDLVNRLVGNTASAEARDGAIEWMVANHQAGLTWGEIIFDAVTFLEGATSGPYAAASEALRARTQYNIEATDGWAWNAGNLETLREVYSAAVTPAGFMASPSNPSAIEQLQAASSSLATAAAGLGTAFAGTGTAYTVAAGDAGRALMMGDGDDTVTVSWGNLDKLPLISGGAGHDKLVIAGSADEYAAFLSKHGGVYDDQPIRGFETVEFQGYNPRHVGGIDGLMQFKFAPETALDVIVAGVDNDTVFNIDLTPSTTRSQITFQDTANYNSAPDALLAPQTVEGLTFNIQAGAAGSMYLPSVPAKDITVNVSAPAGSAFTWAFGTGNDAGGVSMPAVERLDISSDVKINWGMGLIAPNLRTIDLTGSDVVNMKLNSEGARLTDGTIEKITVKAPTGLLAWDWTSAADTIDTGVTFDGVLHAGSTIKVHNESQFKLSGIDTVKAVFGSDFTGAPAAGSIFDVEGWQTAAVQFQGSAPAGASLGKVHLQGNQVTYIKTQTAAGLTLVADDFVDAWGSVGVVVNDGSGSVLANMKSALEAQIGKPLQWMDVAGGRVLWADMDNSGALTGQIYSITEGWDVTGDFVLMETTSANFDQFDAAVQAIGFAIENQFAIF